MSKSIEIMKEIHDLTMAISELSRKRRELERQLAVEREKEKIETEGFCHKMEKNNEFIRPCEAAIEFSIHPSIIRKAMRDGIIQYYIVEGCVNIRRDDMIKVESLKNSLES